MPQTMTASSATSHDAPWWASAVIYQVYIRSFADGNGDGLGDIAGLHSRLGHLVDLGVDALWINPWYPSPMADAGYDVQDYRAIEPRFGTMADAEALIAAAHRHGLRVILDIVPNHTSDQHEWFRAALASGPGSPERARYVFRDGRGPGGDERPNDWPSCFGGPAWTRVVEADGTPGQWYLHLFAPEQPDVNWEHPDVRADFEQTLRFWFDRGVDGFRIDVAHSLIKEAGLPDVGDRAWARQPDRIVPVPGTNPTDHPFWDRDEVHEVYRSWRTIADSYDPPRVFVAEAWVPDPSRMARYLRPDELHSGFNFDFLRCPWVASELRLVIDDTLREHAGVGAHPTWVLSNHDVARHVSRYARPQTHRSSQLVELDGEADLVVGDRRARAALLLELALPGSVYVYQGEELGLPEVEDLPEDALQDPTWERSGHTERGRDGCRVPLPWSASGASFGFGPDEGATPWLPQPSWYARYCADAQVGVEGSMLEFYRTALHLRRSTPALGAGTLRWLDSVDDALVFERDPSFVCAVNLGEAPIEVPAGEALLSSGPLTVDGLLPGDTAVWIRR
jgi:alpha-glucosidase